MSAHRLIAFNTATDSDNKIHDDATARRFGFTGGLVPGVEVFAYMSHIPAALWGEDFLRRGVMSARFLKPVYDGDEATAEGTPKEKTLALALSSRGLLCAEGSASLADPPSVRLDDIPARAPVASEDRPDASPESLAEGTVLGVYESPFDANLGAAYLRDTRETLALFEGGAVTTPGWLLRQANFALAAHVRLGPWIHVGSAVQFHGALREAGTLQTRARVTRHFEKTGHLFAVLDVRVAHEGCVLMSGEHTAIYRPRQVREAG